MASFTRTASALFAAGVSIASAAPAPADDTACARAVAALEAAMQDGLHDFALGDALMAEARLSAKAEGDRDWCAFQANSAEAYARAETHFLACTRHLEQVFTACADPDWSVLSASPEICEARLVEIADRRSVLAPGTAAACDPGNEAQE